MNESDLKYMGIALREAAKGAGKVSPNPMVGAVVVKNGQIIGKGRHECCGLAHAEINALNSCMESPEGADLYVTLEPCSHYGRTPPCVDRIIKEKIRKVFIGIIDPSIHSNGKGVKILNDAGIETESGILEDKCRLLNSAFFHYLEHRSPYVVVKTACSIDGSIATDSGDSKWITCPKSRRHVHKLRNFYDAVLVGKNTVLADDPELTVRMAKGRNPVRVIIDEDLDIPVSMKIFKKNADVFIITSVSASKKKETIYKKAGISLIAVSKKGKHLDLKKAFEELGRFGIRSIMAEGGAEIISYLLKNKLAHRINVFMAPALIGSSKKFFSGSGFEKISDSARLDILTVSKSDCDIFIDGIVRYRR
jgi:diaminohydroxyphosphoribosylaminopyrimidine deaminase / 5-amino-6-(5-phosphoribosylamino)uracil reductase